MGDPFSPHKILLHLERVQAVARGESVAPVTVEIDPSNRCNHRCAWCVSCEAHTGEMLGFDQYRELIGDLRRMDVRSVVLKGGGEPTLHRRFDDMLRVAADAGLGIGLISNGSLPWPTTRDVLLETADWVRISLDAACRETHEMIHGSRDFSRIVEHVIYLRQRARRLLLGLNYVAEPRNVHQTLSFAHFARTLAVDYVSIRCVFDPGRPLSPEQRAELRSQATQARQLEAPGFRVFLGDLDDEALRASATAPFPYRRCLGPNLVGVIGGDGHVYPCCFLRGARQFSFGSLEQQRFSEIWRGARRREVMAGIYEGACGYICRGGLTRSRYRLYNEMLNYLTSPERPHAEFI